MQRSPGYDVGVYNFELPMEQLPTPLGRSSTQVIGRLKNLE
jgi:hypothetical protein